MPCEGDTNSREKDVLPNTVWYYNNVGVVLVCLFRGRPADKDF